MLATGTYVGDGVALRTIVTGLSGTIRFVQASNITVAIDWFKTSTMLGNLYRTFAGANGAGLTFSGADFVVSNDGILNNVGQTYHWVAFSTSP